MCVCNKPYADKFATFHTTNSCFRCLCSAHTHTHSYSLSFVRSFVVVSFQSQFAFLIFSNYMCTAKATEKKTEYVEHFIISNTFSRHFVRKKNPQQQRISTPQTNSRETLFSFDWMCANNNAFSLYQVSLCLSSSLCSTPFHSTISGHILPASSSLTLRTHALTQFQWYSERFF